MTKTTEQTQLDEFETLLDKSFCYQLNVADVVKGVVIKRENDGFLVDIGTKSEAFLPDREIAHPMDKTAEDMLKIGEVKDFYVLKDEEADEANVVLSLKKVSCAVAWQSLQEAKAANETVSATIVNLVKGGVIVEVQDLRGFIPASQLRTGSTFEGLVGQVVDVKVLEADAKKNKLIFSQRQLLSEQRDNLVDDVISSLTLDQIVEGEIIRIADFGAFIDINGVDGLLPISEISWQRIKHPSDILTLGDKIKVKILKIDYDLKRISLSLKRMGENPWDEIEGKFTEGQVIKGTVNKITSFGVFINIFPGVEALLPTSEMEDDKSNPFDVFQVNDEVEVMIKKFTPQEHRIALSIRDIKK